MEVLRTSRKNRASGGRTGHCHHGRCRSAESWFWRGFIKATSQPMPTLITSGKLSHCRHHAPFIQSLVIGHCKLLDAAHLVLQCGRTAGHSPWMVAVVTAGSPAHQIPLRSGHSPDHKGPAHLKDRPLSAVITNAACFPCRATAPLQQIQAWNSGMLQCCDASKLSQARARIRKCGAKTSEAICTHHGLSGEGVADVTRS